MSLEGCLEDLSLADILQIIHVSKKSGVLIVKSHAGRGRIVFYDGQILYASLHSLEKLGERLIREGLIKEQDLEFALRIQKERKVHQPLGAILAENKFIDKDVLENTIHEQLKEVIYELLSWTDGSFKFEPEKPIHRIPPGVSVNTEYILLEGTRLRDEGAGIKPATKEVAHSVHMNKEEGADANTLITLIEEITIPAESTEILLMVLRLAGEVLNRAVIFLISENHASGFGQVGVTTSSADQRIQGLMIPLDKPSVIGDAVHGKMIYKGAPSDTDWNNYLVTHLGEGIPYESFVAPVIAGNNVIAVVYGDNLPYRHPIENTIALEAFIKVAGILYLVSAQGVRPGKYCNSGTLQA